MPYFSSSEIINFIFQHYYYNIELSFNLALISSESCIIKIDSDIISKYPIKFLILPFILFNIHI
jgi:hypothetical protein